jgi:lipoprotein signal peptidase
MLAVLIGFVVVVAVDQALTAVVRALLGTRSLHFGLGDVRGVSSLPQTRESLAPLWGSWIVVAIPLAIVSAIVTPMRWPGGIVLGASFSRLLDASRERGAYKYVCTRWCSPFNLADVLMVVAGVVLAFAFSRAMYTSW